MKIIYGLLTLFSLPAMAQNPSLGIGVSVPHASSVVELASSNRALLLPRMTTTQRTALANPTKGLLVYDITLNALMHFTGNLWSAVGGSVGSFSIPYAGTANNQGTAAFMITSENTATAISGSTLATFTPAIEGTADGGLGSSGVLGQATHPFGIGLQGYAIGGSAVYGFSASGGTALRATAGTGFALKTRGYVQLTGGNTNPVEGAVLTSLDNNGNAVWKKPKQDMAFELAGVYSSFNILAHNVWQKMHFNQEPYDSDNRTVPTTSASVNPSMSSFVVPVTGIYEFEIGIGLKAGGNQQIWSQEVQLMVNRGGNVFAAHTMEGNPNHLGGSLDYRAVGGAQCRLVAGDIVYVNVRQTTNTSTSVIIMSGSDVTFFSGHLVFAE